MLELQNMNSNHKSIIFGILLPFFCFAATATALSQPRQITREEYYQSYRAALTKKRQTSHRDITVQEIYRDGKLFSTTEITDEFLRPDKRHYLEVEKFADHTNKSELIQIGETYYCRRNDGEWKQSKGWCSGGSAFGLTNVVSSEFTVENAQFNGQSTKLFQEYTTYKNIHSPDKDKEGLSYYQTKYWLDEEDLIRREEMELGLIQPKRIYRKQTNSSEYDPKNLRIEAPIR